MRCDDSDCRCMCHVDPSTHVPVCPQHADPLEPSQREPGQGFCRVCQRAGYHAHIAAKWWGWLPRDVFHGEDIPPWNGYPDLDVPVELL